MGRIGLLMVGAVFFFLALEQPAAAHGGAGTGATNFRTTIDGISPALPGARIRLIDAGNRLELRNNGPEIIVLGDDGEPYLRVGPEGAFENELSPTTERNRETVHAARTTPASAETNVSARWRKLSSTPIVRWHQHSIHWLAPRNPTEVDAHPGQRHVVFPRWEIPMRQGPEPAVIFGNLTWIPGPSPAPWLGLMVAAFVGVGALGFLRKWGRPLAVATTLLLSADLIHAGSVAFSTTRGFGAQFGAILTGNFYGIVGWVLAGLAIRFLGRSKVDGLYAGVFAGLSLAVFGGLLDLTTLSRSNLPSALPIDMTRLCIALAGGGGLGLAAACLMVIQRTPDARRVIGGNEMDHP